MTTPSRGGIHYVGHATVRVDVDGVRLLTDPLLRNRVAHLRRATKVDSSALRGVDAVLISHIHHDHLDLPSLERLGREMPVVVPRGAAALIRRKAGIKQIVELSAGEQIEIGGVTVRATYAEHDSTRLPFGARADPLGFLIEGHGSTVYFAGDTDLFDGMADLAPVDVALLPIWGWGPTMGPGHMDPARAAKAAALLRAHTVIPIHWGTYYPIHLGLQGRPEYLDSPPVVFERELALSAPGTRMVALRPGERTDYP